MSFTDFMYADNPFAGLNVAPYTGSPWGPAPFGTPTGPGVWGGVPTDLEPVKFSTEGAIGENVNPLAADSPDKTNDPSKAVAASDTDAGVSAQKKAKGLTDALKGLKAPAAPTPQHIRSPEAPRMAAQKSQLATLLASMGISPQQMLRLGQTFGR